MSRVLVLITGTGRSGTSTMSGTFHHLGLSVPGPHLGANESNPKGFYESKWAVRFHKALASAARINEFDSRPHALERVSSVVTDQTRAQLLAFLQKQQGDQVVVKDPRSMWVQRLWRDVAAEAGFRIAYVSMLRHPAEVVGSRLTYYANPDDAEAQRRYEIFTVARWVNASVISERETRGEPRAFVSYLDLLTDWRQVLADLGERLGLTYDTDVSVPADPEHPNAVDEFIDPGLRRHTVTWEDLQVPGELADIAEAVWQDLLTLQRSDPDAAAQSDLDQQAARYLRLFLDSSAISHDAHEEARKDALVEGERRGAARTAPVVDPLAGVGGRQLVRELGRRVRARVRPT